MNIVSEHVFNFDFVILYVALNGAGVRRSRITKKAQVDEVYLQKY
jgi:hypothetical protein